MSNLYTIVWATGVVSFLGLTLSFGFLRPKTTPRRHQATHRATRHGRRTPAVIPKIPRNSEMARLAAIATGEIGAEAVEDILSQTIPPTVEPYTREQGLFARLCNKPSSLRPEDLLDFGPRNHF
jgi:hypothetical protein